MTSSTATLTLNQAQCVICCKTTDSSKISKKQLKLEEVQCSAFSLLNKLLPSQFSQSMDLCPDCCSLVDNGQQLFNQIQQLEQKLKEIEEEIKMRIGLRPEEEMEQILGHFDDENLSTNSNCSQSQTKGESEMEFEEEFSVKVEEVEKEEEIELKIDPLAYFGLNQDEDCSSLNNSLGSEFEAQTPKPKSNQSGKTKKRKQTKKVAKKRAKRGNKSPKTPKLKSRQKDETRSTAILPVLIKCGICTLTFPTAAELDAHGEIGCEKKVFDQSPILPNGKVGRGCEECGAAFDNPGSLEVHIRCQHLEADALKCQGCFQYFKPTTHYTAHYREMLRADPSSTCVRLAPPPCNLKVCRNILRSSAAAMELHHKVYHVDPHHIPLFKCSTCERTFNNVPGLNAHSRYCCKKLFLE